LTGLQVPAPVHEVTGVYVLPVHVSAPQGVFEAANLQAPAPSQLPSWPHGGLSTEQKSCGSVSIFAAAQVPDAWPVSAIEQALHPLHAVWQQTPSMQYPDEHWLTPEHGAPSIFLALQVLLVVSQ
jgi:hypothetical protein